MDVKATVTYPQLDDTCHQWWPVTLALEVTGLAPSDLPGLIDQLVGGTLRAEQANRPMRVATIDEMVAHHLDPAREIDPMTIPRGKLSP